MGACRLRHSSYHQEVKAWLPSCHLEAYFPAKHRNLPKGTSRSPVLRKRSRESLDSSGLFRGRGRSRKIYLQSHRRHRTLHSQQACNSSPSFLMVINGRGSLRALNRGKPLRRAVGTRQWVRPQVRPLSRPTLRMQAARTGPRALRLETHLLKRRVSNHHKRPSTAQDSFRPTTKTNESSASTRCQDDTRDS